MDDQTDTPEGTEDITIRVPAGARNTAVMIHPQGYRSREDFLVLAAALEARVRTQGKAEGGGAHIFTMEYESGPGVSVTVFGPRVDGQDDLPF